MKEVKSYFRTNNTLSKIKFFAIVVIVLIFSIEILSFISTKFNLLIINHEPAYVHKQGNKWRVENTPWGAWHKPNFKDQHSTECFDTNYQSNNLGARDNENYNKNLPKNSIVLIGDSFAEGYGVNLKNIFPEILEKKTNRKVLNFGSSGNFGAVQAQILYNNLASNLPHNELIYFFLPNNDFTDNDKRYWMDIVHGSRFRPYFKKINEKNYDIFYPSQNVQNKFLINVKSFLFLRLKSFLIQYTYTANTLRSINAILTKVNADKSTIISNPNLGTSYFFDDKEAINGAIFFSKKLLSEAVYLKRRIIVIIPTLIDIDLIQNGKSYKNLKWYQDLKQVSLETNTEFIDLANYFKKEEYKKMIFSCDFHWNVFGHKEVVNLIVKKFY